MKRIRQILWVLVFTISNANAALITNIYESAYSGIKFKWSVTFNSSSTSKTIYSEYDGEVESIIDASCPAGEFCGRYSMLSDATFDFSLLGSIVGSEINWKTGSNYSSYFGMTELEGSFAGISSSELYFYMEPEVYGSSTFWQLKDVSGSVLSFYGNSEIVSSKVAEVSESQSFGLLLLAMLVICTARSNSIYKFKAF